MDSKHAQEHYWCSIIISCFAQGKRSKRMKHISSTFNLHIHIDDADIYTLEAESDGQDYILNKHITATHKPSLVYIYFCY